MEYAPKKNTGVRAKTTVGHAIKRSMGARVNKLGQVEERVFEKNTLYVTTKSDGTLSNFVINGDPAGLLIASRLTGYQALRDDCRLDKVVLDFVPLFHGTTGGEVAFYIERETAESVVTTLPLACDQFECSHGQFGDCLSLTWVPQQPSDKIFQPLIPGTVPLFSVYGVVNTAGLSQNGTGISTAQQIYTVTVSTWMTLRGRP